MKNRLNRNIPDNYKAFISSIDYLNYPRTRVDEVLSSNKGNKLRNSISKLFDELTIVDGMTLSFHHHLRNGDEVMNLVFSEIKRRNLKDITIAASGIFPIHVPLVELIENKNVTKIYTNYLNGPVAKAVSMGMLEGLVIMDTHGGRTRAIESGDIRIDVAFIAASACDKIGNANAVDGKSNFGSMGYITPDVLYSKKKVVVCDNLVDKLNYIEIEAKYIDYCLLVNAIGDKSGIISGTTKITKDPVGLKIASDTVNLLDELGIIENGFSMQTGAGGISLAVTKYLNVLMKKKKVKASFMSGGISKVNVMMLEEGLVDNLYDVQCFDLDAVRSIKTNKHHHHITCFRYANVYEDTIINKLDFVILGATEVDLDFNVNVTTGSNGLIMGGSGGHADTAHCAKVSIIASPLINSRNPLIKESVRSINTPGEDVDIIVTERGMAINPRRDDLKELLKDSRLKIYDIKELYEIAHNITGIPARLKQTSDVIGVIRHRDLSIIDSLYRINK